MLLRYPPSCLPRQGSVGMSVAWLLQCICWQQESEIKSLAPTQHYVPCSQTKHAAHHLSSSNASEYLVHMQAPAACLDAMLHCAHNCASGSVGIFTWFISQGTCTSIVIVSTHLSRLPAAPACCTVSLRRLLCCSRPSILDGTCTCSFDSFDSVSMHRSHHRKSS